ncbi:MAG: hypothetical protein MRY74_00080 [Neomegalonema sp.]|nr:hypothetical protein [Neomegalonema sp.]
MYDAHHQSAEPHRFTVELDSETRKAAREHATETELDAIQERLSREAMSGHQLTNAQTSLWITLYPDAGHAADAGYPLAVLYQLDAAAGRVRIDRIEPANPDCFKASDLRGPSVVQRSNQAVDGGELADLIQSLLKDLGL